jgi:5-methylcytosine-specific restriction endonuclease McrA
MLDLFGNAVNAPQEKSDEEEYQDYISSAMWRRKAKDAIKRAGNKCEECGISKWSITLEVHHLTYEHFKHERLEELRALCPECHKRADEDRLIATLGRQAQRRWDARFEAWARKVYGECWREMNTEAIENHFRLWLEQQ